MGREAALRIMLTLLLAGMLTLESNIQPVKAEPKTWTVDDYGQADFHTIQAAINAANWGDSIEVAAGTYYEHVVINKTLTLVGAGRSITSIDGNRTGSVVTVKANNVTLRGFAIQNGLGEGVYIVGFNQITISENAIISNGYAGLDLYNSNNNTISNNTIAFHQKGIWPESCNNNLIDGNTILNNDVGIDLYQCSNNVFYHNNLINNTSWQVDSDKSSNTWDAGYPSGGNYWSDYNGTDANGDGIGDTPYVMNGTYSSFGDNPDRYPLMEPWRPVEDDTPPITINDYDGLWHTADFTINLTAVDDSSGVQATYYRINNGSVCNVSADGQPFITTQSSNNTLEYWSVDKAGNNETHHLLTNIKLDKTAPTGSVIINNNASYANSTSVTLTPTAVDAVSGVFQVFFRCGLAMTSYGAQNLGNPIQQPKNGH